MKFVPQCYPLDYPNSPIMPILILGLHSLHHCFQPPQPLNFRNHAIAWSQKLWWFSSITDTGGSTRRDDIPRFECHNGSKMFDDFLDRKYHTRCIRVLLYLPVHCERQCECLWGLYELSRRNEGTHRCSSIEVFRHYPIESKVRVLFFGNPVTRGNIIDNTIARDTRHGCLTAHVADPLPDNHRQLHFPVDHFRIVRKENGFTRTDQRRGWRL